MTTKLSNKVNSVENKKTFDSMLDAFTEAVKTSNVKVVYNYPGRPATSLVDDIKANAKNIDVQDYLPNEFVAAAKGFGSSVAGCERSLVVFKDVGTNVACDHFYCLNHVGINRGLVFFISDDPSAWHSQNEQDSRAIYFNAGLPFFEPHDQYSAYYSMLAAYEMSEIYRLPFFVRTTGRALTEKFDTQRNDFNNITLPIARDIVDIPFDALDKWKSIFGTVEEDKEELYKKQEQIAKEFDKLALNVVKGSGKLGVISCGFPATQLENEGLINGLSLLKLVTVYPLPETLIVNFIKDKERILIVEQGEPLLEMLVRDLAQRNGINIQISGRLNNCVRKVGEFRDDDLKISMNAFKGNKRLPVFPKHKKIAKAPAFESNNGFKIMVECLRNAVKTVGCRPLYCGDAGQPSRIPETPGLEEMMHLETTMGCSVSYLTGGIEAYIRAGVKSPFKGIAYIGDSDFFHSALPGVCEAIAKNIPMLMLLINNQGAVSTGGQYHLGMKINDQIKEISIKKVLDSLGTNHLEEANIKDQKDLTDKLIKGLKNDGFAVVMVHLE